MFFRLSNAPANFQGYINKNLAKKLEIFVIVYLDNIFIYIKNPSKGHVETVSIDFIKIKFVFWAILCWPRKLEWKINKLRQ